VEVTPTEGASILKVELYADDRVIATLLDPPYSFTWDAGDSLAARTLRAKAYASGGVTATHKVTTRALVGAQKARVTLVQVYCTVRDSQGGYLMELQRDDFTVLESGVKQRIATFTSERKPANLVLLFDASASMARDGRIETAKEAAEGFVEALEPEDTASLIAFNDVPRVIQIPTSDHAALQAGIGSIEAKGGTALYDAIVDAVAHLRDREGRKAIILLSDGRDESLDGMGPGSIATFEDALDALLKSETAIYAIGTGQKLEEELDFERRRTIGEIMGTMAGRSGGRAFFIKSASKLKDAYRRIEDELRHQYTLAYYPGDEPAAGKKAPGSDWRPIEVRVSRPRARVTARSGYFAR
ncbi:MAG: VWA domain-containing protein, partial [Candidatus Rokuibacteriota bacterium]